MVTLAVVEIFGLSKAGSLPRQSMVSLDSPSIFEAANLPISIETYGGTDDEECHLQDMLVIGVLTDEAPEGVGPCLTGPQLDERHGRVPLRFTRAFV